MENDDNHRITLPMGVMTDIELRVLDRLRDWNTGAELADRIEAERRGSEEWREAWRNAGDFLLDLAERRFGDDAHAVSNMKVCSPSTP